jgi:hypothetical protein
VSKLLGERQELREFDINLCYNELKEVGEAPHINQHKLLSFTQTGYGPLLLSIVPTLNVLLGLHIRALNHEVAQLQVRRARVLDDYPEASGMNPPKICPAVRMGESPSALLGRSSLQRLQLRRWSSNSSSQSE